MKRIRILTAVYFHLIGKETYVTHEEINENGDLIYCTGIPHPEDESTFLWVNESDISYISKYNLDDEVHWNDPSGDSSGIYKIKSQINEDGENTIYLISNGTSEAEAYEYELT